MTDVIVGYPLHIKALGPLSASFESVETKNLQGAYLHYAFLQAMDIYELVLAEFLPDLTMHRVRHGTGHGDLQTFVPESTADRLREIVVERLGPTVEVPVLKRT